MKVQGKQRKSAVPKRKEKARRIRVKQVGSGNRRSNVGNEETIASSFLCTTCGRKYKSCKSLANHKKVACGKKYSVSLSKCTFADCTREFYHKSKILQHLKEDHHQEAQETVLTFDSKDDFLRWKEKEERTNYVYFSKRRKESVSGDSTLAYYVCQHDGQIYSHRKSTEPARKTARKYRRGSVRKNIVCLARMMVKYTMDKVEVRYISSHSHEVSLKNTEFQPIPSEVKHFINEQLSKGISPKEVMGKLQEKLSERDQRDTQNHMKVQNLNLQTIYQMKKRMQRGKGSEATLNTDDATGVARKVEKLRSEYYDPVFVYKAPQCSDMVVGSCEDPEKIENFDDFFVLGIQTKEQKEMMLKDGSERVICVDGSTNAGINDLYLYTILVLDEFGSSYPTCYFVTNRKSKAVLVVIFGALLVRCPEFQCATALTDDDPILHSALLHVLGENRIRCIMRCQWHVRRNWQKILSEEVSNLDLRNEILSKLVIILKLPMQEGLHEMTEKFCEFYKHKAPKVVEVFRKNYLPSIHLWATCYRFPCSESDDGFVEPYHEKLTSYLGPKTGRRLLDLLDALLKMEVEIYIERLRNLNPPNQESNSTVMNRHKASLKILDGDVSKGTSAGTWYVKSHKAKESHYVIAKQFDQCPSVDFCMDRCKEVPCINLCHHLYLCTCPDRAVLCKHIHKVHSIRIKQHGLVASSDSEVETYLTNMLQESNSQQCGPAATTSTSFHVEHLNSNQLAQLNPKNINPAELDVQVRQVVSECQRLCKIVEYPAVKKCNVLASILGTIQHLVKQCEAVSTKPLQENQVPNQMLPTAPPLYLAQNTTTWGWNQY